MVRDTYTEIATNVFKMRILSCFPSRTKEESEDGQTAGWDWETEGAAAAHQIPVRSWTAS